MATASYTISATFLLAIASSLAAGCVADGDSDPDEMTGEAAQALDPNIVLTLAEPIESGAVLYERLAPAVTGGSMQARISVRMTITNHRTTPLTISRITILGQAVTTSAFTPVIVPGNGGMVTLQNCSGGGSCTGYAPLVINAPVPASATVAIYEGVGIPPVAQQTVTLASHVNDGGPLSFVGKARDLAPNESWGATSDHVADHQVFALDVGVLGYNATTHAWDERYTGADTDAPEGFRVYGMPMYAVADGTVCWALNDQPERTTISGPNTQPPSPSLGTYNHGGNQIFISSGTEISVLAHLQPGSIPPELLVPGATVTKGQYIGKGGLSGDTSAPAPHIHVKKAPAVGAPALGTFMNSCDAGFFRPMGFSGLQSLTLSEGNALASAGNPLTWTTLSNQSASSPYDLLFPQTGAVPFCASCSDSAQYIGVLRAGSSIDLRVKAQGWTDFVARRNSMSADGFRLTEIETFVENGHQAFVGVFTRATGAADAADSADLQNFTSWSAFASEVTTLNSLGRVLVDVATYLEGTTRHFVGVFRAGTDAETVVSDSSWSAFTSEWVTLSGLGLRLTDIETFDTGGGNRQYIGIYRAGSGGYALWSGTGWSAFTTEWSTLRSSGLRLVDVETFPVGAQRQYVGVFKSGTDGSALFSITGYENYIQQMEHWNSVGLRSVDVHVEHD